jgi:predicted DNA-binding transcriptional regulator AlpA
MGRILNIREVSEKTRIAVSTLRKYTMLEQLPFKKVGTRVVFDEAQIDAWLDARSAGLDSMKAGPLKKRRGVRGNKKEAETAELFPAEREGAGV